MINSSMISVSIDGNNEKHLYVANSFFSQKTYWFLLLFIYIESHVI